MAKRTFQIAVTKYVQVEVDPEKLDEQFFKEFQESITHYSTVEEIAEHIAWNYVRGAEDFVEGIGSLDEMNIRVSEVDGSVELQTEMTADDDFEFGVPFWGF